MLDAYADVLMRKRGVMLLGIPMSGVGYVFQTRFRPSDLSTFKGKKIRSIPLYDPILQTLGAVPVTTSPAEAYTAMERGVVDGLGWPDLGLLDFKFYEHARARFELSESVWGIPFGFGVWLKMLAGDGGQYRWRNIFPKICASG